MEHSSTPGAVSPRLKLARVSQQAGRLGLRAAAGLASVALSCPGTLSPFFPRLP